MQRMLQRADQEHHDAQRSLLQHVAELDAKVLTLEKEARESEHHVRAATQRLHLTAAHPPARGVIIGPGANALGQPPPPYKGRMPEPGDQHTGVFTAVPVAQPVLRVPASQPQDHIEVVVSELMMFGFSEDAVRDALRATGGDKQAAANRLLG